jgi:cytosine/adenosine deaminase-related metal-dependent hydrolase
MQKYQAEWIFPVCVPPIRNGVVITDDEGVIETILDETTAGDDVQKHKGIICPGFVNAHTHLELSWMKNLLNEGTGLDGFIQEVERFKGQAHEEEILQAILSAGNEMLSSGTVACGDISNTLHTIGFKQQRTLLFHNFIEVFGSHPEVAVRAFSNVRRIQKVFHALLPEMNSSVVPHATYSLSADLFKMVCSHAENSKSLLTIHHAESLSETELFKNRSGKMAERMKHWNVPDDYLPFTGTCPVETIAPFLPVDNRIMFVHNTYASPEDINFIATGFKDAWFTLCPRSNLYIEATLPPVDLIRRSTDKILIGTDSPASVYNLKMIDEMHCLQTAFPHLQFDELLTWATLNGARFFGWVSKLGSIEPGKKPGLVNILGVNPETGIWEKNYQATRIEIA